jgi:hypothetical protein
VSGVGDDFNNPHGSPLSPAWPVVEKLDITDPGLSPEASVAAA